MTKALPWDDIPSDTAQVEAEVDRMLAEIDRSLRRMDEAEQEFDLLALETDTILKTLTMPRHVETALQRRQASS